MTAPIDLTPNIYAPSAAACEKPAEAGQFFIDLADAALKYYQHDHDLKNCTLIARGGDLYVNVSYSDGTNDSPGNLTATSNDSKGRRLKVLQDSPVTVPQEVKYNRVFATSVGGSGTFHLEIWPGMSLGANGLTPGVTTVS